MTKFFKIMMGWFPSVLLLAGCAAASQHIGTLTGAAGLRAWVDAPLDQTSLPFSVTYPVVCHGTDPKGAAAVEFSVDGAVISSSPNPNVSQTLYTAYFDWQPPAPGKYILQCRAQNRASTWSSSAQARVEVIQGITPIFTSVPTFTPTPTPITVPTSTPTPVLTLTPTPVPTSTPTPVPITPTPIPVCSQYTDEASCKAHGCKWKVPPIGGGTCVPK